MKTTLLVAFATIAVAASPALAQKKKGKSKHKPVAAAKESRRLCDELGLGLTLATPGADPAAKKPVTADDGAALAQATSYTVDNLEDRKNSMPSGDATQIHMQAQTLTSAQIAEVVKGHGDVGYCWDRLPAAQRSASALSMHLVIEARGNVSAISIAAAPKAFASCMETAAKRWQFPIADTQTVSDYPLVLN